jgi:hypothetical protein
VSGLASIAEGVASAQPDLESKLFATALSVFIRVDRDVKWRPLEVLSAIEEEMKREPEGGVDVELVKSLESIRLILNNERDFKPLNTGKGLDAAKALLMALLRPDPERLLSWERAQSGADDAVWSAAASLVGALSGYRMLPASLKRTGLDNFLETSAITRLGLGGDRNWTDAHTFGASEIEVLEVGQGDAAVARLVLRGVTILETHLAPASLQTRLLDLDASSASNVSLLAAIATRLDWTDCFRTTVVLPSREFVVSASKKERQFSISTVGVVEVETSLDLAAFRTKLEAQGIPVALESDLRDLLAANEPVSHQ